MPLDRAKDKNAPGGSLMPATNYSKSKARGTSNGKEIKQSGGTLMGSNTSADPGFYRSKRERERESWGIV